MGSLMRCASQNCRPGWGFDEIKPALNRTATAEQDDRSKIVFTTLLMLIRNCVGAGSLAPKPEKISPKTGTTFTSRKMVIQNRDDRHDCRIHHGRLDLLAQSRGIFQIGGQPRQDFGQQTAFFTGGNHADIQAVENFGMFLQRFGETVAAFDSAQTSLMTSRMTLLVVCSASACSDCTIAKPASIIVASWRVKMTRSARATLPPPVLPFLPTFSWIETTSRLRFSRAAMAACSVAASTELRIFAAGGRFPRYI